MQQPSIQWHPTCACIRPALTRIAGCKQLRQGCRRAASAAAETTIACCVKDDTRVVAVAARLASGVEGGSSSIAALAAGALRPRVPGAPGGHGGGRVRSPRTAYGGCPCSAPQEGRAAPWLGTHLRRTLEQAAVAWQHRAANAATLEGAAGPPRRPLAAPWTPSARQRRWFP